MYDEHLMQQSKLREETKYSMVLPCLLSTAQAYGMRYLQAQASLLRHWIFINNNIGRGLKIKNYTIIVYEGREKESRLLFFHKKNIYKIYIYFFVHKMLYLKNPYSFLKHIIVIPLISTVIIPLIITDIWMEIYHRICFPFYGMPYVKRSDYISIMDRAKLPYLNILQKLYCMYCGYENGVLRYWAQIA